MTLLHEAADACRAALRVGNEKDPREDGAQTQTILGSTLGIPSQRLDGRATDALRSVDRRSARRAARLL